MLKRKGKLIAGYLIGSFVISTSLFSNCSVSHFEVSETSELPSKVDSQSLSGGVVINNNAPYTIYKDVQLNMLGFDKINPTLLSGEAEPVGESYEMYVTTDSQCMTGGTWESLQMSKPWQLVDANKENKVYVKFSHKEGEQITLSECFSDSIIHDDLGPELTVLQAPPKVTSTSSLHIKVHADDSGSGVDGYQCSLLDGSSPTACSEDIELMDLPEGPGGRIVIAKDKAGNISEPKILTWEIDRTPPIIAIQSGPSGISNQSSSTFAFSVSDNRPGGLTIKCKIDGGEFTDCSSPTTYTLPDGNHAFLVMVTDEAGNSTTSQPYPWTIDQTAASVKITKQPPLITNERNAIFEFASANSTDVFVRYECKLDASDYVNCTSPLTYSSLTGGMHSFFVRGYDAAQNRSAPASYSWTIDLNPPSVAWTAVPASYTNSIQVAFNFTANDDIALEKTECRRDGEITFTPCAAPLVLTTSEQEISHQLAVRAIDKAGNISPMIQHSWTVDRTPPLITWVKKPVQVSTQTVATFEYSAIDQLSGVAKIECRLDSASFVGCDTIKSFSGLGFGSHTFEVRATDKAGNSATEAYSFLISENEFACKQMVALSLVNGVLEVPARTADGICYFYKIADAISSSASNLTVTMDSEVDSRNHDSNKIVYPNRHPYVLAKALLPFKLLGLRKMKLSGSSLAPGSIKVDNYVLSGIYPSSVVNPDSTYYRAYGTEDAGYYSNGVTNKYILLKGQAIPLASFGPYGTATIAALDISTEFTINQPYRLDLRALDCGGSRELSKIFLLFQ